MKASNKTNPQHLRVGGCFGQALKVLPLEKQIPVVYGGSNPGESTLTSLGPEWRVRG